MVCELEKIKERRQPKKPKKEEMPTEKEPVVAKPKKPKQKKEEKPKGKPVEEDQVANGKPANLGALVAFQCDSEDMQRLRVVRKQNNRPGKPPSPFWCVEVDGKQITMVVDTWFKDPEDAKLFAVEIGTAIESYELLLKDAKERRIDMAKSKKWRPRLNMTDPGLCKILGVSCVVKKAHQAKAVAAAAKNEGKGEGSGSGRGKKRKFAAGVLKKDPEVKRKKEKDEEVPEKEEEQEEKEEEEDQYEEQEEEEELDGEEYEEERYQMAICVGA